MVSSVRPVRAVFALLTIALVLVNTACVTTEPSLPPAAAPVAAPVAVVEPPVSGYIAMLRSQGLDASIPTHGKFILVNVPSFELIALQDGVPVLRSRVIVGKPAAPTPQLIASLTAIQFNPSWTPTPNMMRNEGLHYMPPGPQNPLGRIMFDMDDDESIYLHDTPEKVLFKREQRALSHGCVRVEQARALAAWALGVSEEEIDSMSARGTYSVPLTENIPVSLVYYTRFPDESGRLVPYPDIYANR